MTYERRVNVLVVSALCAGAFLIGGCEKKTTPPPPATGTAKTESAATKEKPREPLIKKQEIADWCPEHGVPESICTRCNASLIEGFKAKGDWCKEHDLPESQCFVCHPELKQKFEAMKPKGTQPSATGTAKTESAATKEKLREPLIKKQEIADWCPEHGVPESICTRCNSSLIEGYKAKNDWCKEHDLPESQCFVCHPELKEKFEAMKPKGS